MDGVDGIFIGPFDLSIGLGIGGQFDNPDFKAALEKVKKACAKAGKFVIIFTMDPGAAPGYFAEGYDSVLLVLTRDIISRPARPPLKGKGTLK